MVDQSGRSQHFTYDGCAICHAGETAESQSVYVTWDEWAIVADMIGELSAAMASSTAYTTAEDALLSCMNATATSTTTSTSTGSVPKSGRGARSDTRPPAATFAGFDDLLASYTGDVKARMEAGGDCAATSTAMFNANQTETRDELARLKAGRPVYAAWLATSAGRYFEGNVGNPNRLKLVTNLMALQSQNEGAIGQPLPGQTILPTGLGCVPIDPVPSIYSRDQVTLPLKLAVLNCLILSTPFSFWTDTAQTDELKMRINDDYTWLGYDTDWECTQIPDLIVPNRQSCLRHDVALGSLVEFDGSTSTHSFGENDLAWNPRNRYLVDELFAVDLACGMQIRNVQNPCVRLGRSELSWLDLELRIEWVSSKLVGGGFKWLSDKAFGVKAPVTALDAAHASATPRFVQCYMPSIDVTDVRRGLNQRIFVGEWTFSANSCTGQTYTVESIAWLIQYSDLPTGITKNKVPASESGTSSQLILSPWEFVDSLTGVEVLSAYLRVDDDVKYGGRHLHVTIEHDPTLP